MKRRILCLHLLNWPIQRVLAERNLEQVSSRVPERSEMHLAPCRSVHFARGGLMHPTVVLLHALDPRRGQLVVACDDAALACGVRLGMPLAEAATLAGKVQRSTFKVQGSEDRRLEGRGQRLEIGSQKSEVRDQNSSTWNLEPETWNSEPLILPYDPAADLAELARLAEHCERFSPLVGWETAEAQVPGSKFQVPSHQALTWNLEPGTWNALFLDVTGIGVLFGGEERLAAAAVADLARFGYRAQAAVADTIGAAWAAASQFQVPGFRFQGQEEARSAECGARSAEDNGNDKENNDKENNDKQNVVLSTQYSVPGTFSPAPSSQLLAPSPQLLAPFRAPGSALRALPLSTLRLPLETLDLLAQLGIRQLGELLALPRSSLRARFGERLLLRLDQLTGAAQETIVPYRPPPKFTDQWVLEYPAERREIIGQIVRELISRVAACLAERREGVVQLHCRLDCAPGSPVRIEVGLFRPSADPRHLWELVRMQLDQTRLPGPVGRVTLAAALTAPLENRQAELFAGGRDEAQRQLALLLDRVASRLGPEAVLRPQLTADPLPERAVNLGRVHERSEMHRRKFQVPGSKFQVRKKSSHGTLNLEPGIWNCCFRPLFLHSPLPLDTVSVVPDGPPITFRLEGKLHRVAHHWGPERIETGWFRGPSVRRDYYRVQTTAGLRFWLFRRLDDGRWHLHGQFG